MAPMITIYVTGRTPSMNLNAETMNSGETRVVYAAMDDNNIAKVLSDCTNPPKPNNPQDLKRLFEHVRMQ